MAVQKLLFTLGVVGACYIVGNLLLESMRI
jgi:hypothetical protein